MGNIHIETYASGFVRSVTVREDGVLHCDNGFAYLELMDEGLGLIQQDFYLAGSQVSFAALQKHFFSEQSGTGNLQYYDETKKQRVKLLCEAGKPVTKTLHHVDFKTPHIVMSYDAYGYAESINVFRTDKTLLNRYIRLDDYNGYSKETYARNGALLKSEYSELSVDNAPGYRLVDIEDVMVSEQINLRR